MWTWLEKLGYDRDLYLIRSRTFMLSVHSRSLEEEQGLEVRIKDAVGTDIEDKVNEMVLEMYGGEEEHSIGYAVLKREGAVFSSYRVRNTGDKLIEVVMETNGQLCSGKTGLGRRVVKPGEVKFLMHTEKQAKVKHTVKEL